MNCKEMTEDALCRAVMETLPDPLLVIDAEGRYLVVLGARERSLYDSGAYLVGRRIHEVVGTQNAERFMDAIRRAIETRSLQVVTYRLAGSDCSGNPADGPAGEQWFEGRVYPLDRKVFATPAVVWLCLNITERVRSQEAHARALAEIRTLQGIIPICSACKKIRDDQGSWQQLEAYIQAHSEAQFSHGLCPDCCQRLYPDLYRVGAATVLAAGRRRPGS